MVRLEAAEKGPWLEKQHLRLEGGNHPCPQGCSVDLHSAAAAALPPCDPEHAVYQRGLCFSFASYKHNNSTHFLGFSRAL